nr:MAG TPA: hypothetical protein [Caudoviricetes sp.]
MPRTLMGISSLSVSFIIPMKIRAIVKRGLLKFLNY